jgi:hypothetical protein
MDVKLVLVALTVLFTVSCLFFGTKNGFTIQTTIMETVLPTN